MTKLLLAATLTISAPAWPSGLVLKNTPVQVYFSPHGGCQDVVVATIWAAKKTVLVQAYSFTSAPIAAALKKAHDYCVDIGVIHPNKPAPRTSRCSCSSLMLNGLDSKVKPECAEARSRAVWSIRSVESYIGTLESKARRRGRVPWLSSYGKQKHLKAPIFFGMVHDSWGIILARGRPS